MRHFAGIELAEDGLGHSMSSRHRKSEIGLDTGRHG